jgi:putative ABC transport system permease protein
MNFVVPLKQFFNDIRRQKLRTAMTMFGILWGTCSIVLLFAFGKGIMDAQVKSMKGLGENIAIFWPGITSKEFQGLPTGRRIRPVEADMVLIKQKAKNISRISPEYSRWNIPLKYSRQVTLRQVVGVWPEYGEMRNVIPQHGSRFINQRDMDERRRVVFIGDRLKRDLFGDEPAVGQTILINGMPFTVIGVLKPKDQDSSYSGRDNRKCFIPSTTFKTMFSRRYVNNFVAQAHSTLPMSVGIREVYDILGAKYRFDPDDREALSVWDITESVAFFKNFFMAFRTFLVGIGVATLITGGIGVSNIMNVVLEDRTKEIGIKMALGARKSTVLLQFIMETLLITFIGGIIGFIVAFAIVQVVPFFGVEDYIGVPTVNMWAGVIITGLLGFIGLVAGIFPARRAANLQPVEALKLF